jgi:hypothetical protein
MCCWIALVFFVFGFTGKLVAPILPQAVNTFALWFKGLSYFFLIPYLTAVTLDFFFAFMDSEQPRPATGPEAGAFLGLIVLILMFGNFYYSVQVTARQFETEVTLAPDNKAESRPKPAHIVRAIDNGFFMILQDAPDRVVFVKKDTVIMLSMKVQK